MRDAIAISVVLRKRWKETGFVNLLAWLLLLVITILVTLQTRCLIDKIQYFATYFIICGRQFETDWNKISDEKRRKNDYLFVKINSLHEKGQHNTGTLYGF